MSTPAGETTIFPSDSFSAEAVSSEDNVAASTRETSAFNLTDNPFCNSLNGALARGSAANRTMIHAFVSNSGHFPFLHNVLLTMIHNIELPWTPLILSLGEGVCPMLANVTELQGHYICVPYLERLLDQLQKYEPESVEEIMNAPDDDDEEDDDEDDNESDSDDEDNAADNDDAEIDYDNEPAAAEENGVENNAGVINNNDSLDNNEEDDENDDNDNNGEEYDDGGEIIGVDDNDGADKIMEPDDNEPNEDEEPQAAATEDISTLRRSTRSKHDDITTEPELITAPKNDSDHHHDRLFGALDKTFFGWGSKKHKFLINSKLYALLDILECGADAFITDTDIGFRKDPRPYFDVAGLSGDIIAQNDTNLENYELDINSGFMYWKRTPQNLDLIKDILTGECIVQYYVYP